MHESIVNTAKEIQPRLTEIRRDFHAYAETGWLEMRTASLVARRLTELGYEVLMGEDALERSARTGVPSEAELMRHYEWALANGGDAELLPRTMGGLTAVIGVLRCGEGPAVAYRFDMDALPLTESGEREHTPACEGFASETRGVMHACGHDGHTAIGLGTAELIMKRRNMLRGTVKLIFQPAEEGVRGARAIVEKGHLDDVDYVLAGHMGGTKDGGFGIGLFSHGAVGLATSKLNAHLRGAAAHAGVNPQTGHNAMLAASTAALNIHAIPRYGTVPTQVNVGKLTAGCGRNIVADSAELEIEVRGATDEANGFMLDCAQRIVEGAAAMHGCAAEISITGSAPAFTNDEALTERVRAAGAETGLPAIELASFGGCDDFAYMAERVQSRGGQSCYFSLLAPCAAPLHDREFDFDERALANGAALFSELALDLLKP